MSTISLDELSTARPAAAPASISASELATARPAAPAISASELATARPTASPAAANVVENIKRASANYDAVDPARNREPSFDAVMPGPRFNTTSDVAEMRRVGMAPKSSPAVPPIQGPPVTTPEYARQQIVGNAVTSAANDPNLSGAEKRLQIDAAQRITGNQPLKLADVATPATGATRVAVNAADPLEKLPWSVAGTFAPDTALQQMERIDAANKVPGTAWDTAERAAVGVLPYVAAGPAAPAIAGLSAAGDTRIDIARRRQAGEQISGGEEAGATVASGLTNAAMMKLKLGAGERAVQNAEGSIVGNALRALPRTAAESTAVSEAGNTASNFIAGQTYDPNRPITQNAGDAAIAGLASSVPVAAGAAIRQGVESNRQAQAQRTSEIRQQQEASKAQFDAEEAKIDAHERELQQKHEEEQREIASLAEENAAVIARNKARTMEPAELRKMKSSELQQTARDLGLDPTGQKQTDLLRSIVREQRRLNQLAQIAAPGPTVEPRTPPSVSARPERPAPPVPDVEPNKLAALQPGATPANAAEPRPSMDAANDQAMRQQRQTRIKSMSEEQLRALPPDQLRQAAADMGVHYDAPSTTIPRLLDASDRASLEQMSDKELWDEVRGRGLKAGSRRQNIETLLNAPKQQEQPATAQQPAPAPPQPPQPAPSPAPANTAQSAEPIAPPAQESATPAKAPPAASSEETSPASQAPPPEPAARTRLRAELRARLDENDAERQAAADQGRRPKLRIVPTKHLEKFAGELWADQILNKRAAAKQPSPTALGQRKLELENQLRDQVIEEFGRGAADLSSNHPLAIAADRGESPPRVMISPEKARELAATLPEAHPARLTLHNLQELEKNPPRTKVQKINTNEAQDGQRVQVNDGETFTIDKENEVIHDGITAPIPEGGVDLYGKKILPPAEHALADEPFVTDDVLRAAGKHTGRDSASHFAGEHEQEQSNAAVQGPLGPDHPQEQQVAGEQGSRPGDGAQDRAGAGANEPQGSEPSGQQGVQQVTPPSPEQPVTDQSQTKNTGKPGRPRRGFLQLPDPSRLLGAWRGMRERVGQIATRYGDAIGDAITRFATTSRQALGIEDRFRRAAFGDDLDAYKQFVELGAHYRGDILEAMGKQRGNLPKLSPAEVRARLNDPKIARAIELYNRDISPLLTGIRAAGGQVMNSRAGSVPFFLNLVNDSEPGYGARPSASFKNKAFNTAASGLGEYEDDPIKFMRAAIGGHLANAAKDNLVEAIDRISTAKSNLTVEKKPGEPDAFYGHWRGEKEPFAPVDLNAYRKGAQGQNLPPDLRYVPEPVKRTLETIRPAEAPSDNPLAIVNRAFSRGRLFGSGVAHALRNVGDVGARLGQNPQSLLELVPWIGSRAAAVRQGLRMKGSPLGAAMQQLVEGWGASRAQGYGLDVQSTGAKIANFGHELIMNQEHGTDPLGRRVLAHAYLLQVLDPAAVKHAEAQLQAGASPVKVAEDLNGQLSAKQRLDGARYVNTAMGFLDPTTRAGAINHASAILPYIGTESGMIPNELKTFATGNLKPSLIGRSVRQGDYGQALRQLAGQLASGPLGTFVALQALNLASSKINHGQARFTWDNPDGHRLDVEIPGASGWYLSNLDPGFSRAARMLAVRAGLDHDTKGAGGVAKELGRENLNEALSTLSPMIHAAVAGLSGRDAYMTRHQGWGKATVGELTPMVGNTLSSLQRGDSAKAGAAKDAASLVGLNVSPEHEESTPSRSAPRTPRPPAPPRATRRR